MSSGMVSRWPVLLSLPVGATDRDEDGRLTDAGVERLFAQARAAYFEQCRTVDASALKIVSCTVQRGRAEVGDGASVSVNVVEVFPDRFTMTAMLRPDAGGDIAATAFCSLSPGGIVSTAMRDEFIALAHAARYVH
jgi:hypothetical protein